MFRHLISKKFQNSEYIDFKTSENSLLVNRIQSGKSVIELYDLFLNLLDKLEFESAETIKVILFENKLLALSENNEKFKLFTIDNKLNLITEKKYDLLSATQEAQAVSSYPDSINEGFVGLLKGDTLVWKQEIVYLPFFHNDFFCGFTELDENWVIDKGIIKCFELKQGKLLWSKSVKDIGKYYNQSEMIWHEGEVDRFLGMNDKTLWLCLSNGLLASIDIDSGDIKHEVSTPKEYPIELHMMQETKVQNFFYNHNSIIDEKNGKIFRLWHTGDNNGSFDWYFEVDLKAKAHTLNISKVKNISEIPFTIDGNPCPLWPFDDEFVYVCNYRDYKIALFNRKSRQIEWVHEIEVDSAAKSFIIKMEIQNNHWYILDNSNNLFVYERSSTVASMSGLQK